MKAAPLPFVAEPVDSLVSRYGAAIEPLVNQEDVAEGRRERPVVDRRHVFDCQDGMRLIVSREVDAGGRIGVHMSASISAHGDAYESLKRLREAGGDATAAFFGMALDRWAVISGATAIDATFVGLSRGLVPHWVAFTENSPS